MSGFLVLFMSGSRVPVVDRLHPHPAREDRGQYLAQSFLPALALSLVSCPLWPRGSNAPHSLALSHMLPYSHLCAMSYNPLLNGFFCYRDDILFQRNALTVLCSILFLEMQRQTAGNWLAGSSYCGCISLTAVGFPTGSDVKNLPTMQETTCNAGDSSSTPGSGRSPGERNGYPLQYSWLENPIDRGVWWAIVHGVAKSQIQFSD